MVQDRIETQIANSMKLKMWKTCSFFLAQTLGLFAWDSWLFVLAKSA